MRAFLVQSAVLATAFLGAFCFPAEDKDLKEKRGIAPVTLTREQVDKLTKEFSLFGTSLAINVNKNGSVISYPAFINASGNYDNTYGIGGDFSLPLIPFPFGLFFPNYPQLNFSLGYVNTKNLTGSLEAGVGNFSAEVTVGSGEVDSQGSGWTTPKPQGWGWESSTQGWTTPGWNSPTQGWTQSTTTTTQGWSTPGWSSPTQGWTTSGWTTQPPTTTTTGWTTPPPTTTTQGWTTPPPTTTTTGWTTPPPTTTTTGWTTPPPTTTTPGWTTPPPTTTTTGWTTPPPTTGWPAAQQVLGQGQSQAQGESVSQQNQAWTNSKTKKGPAAPNKPGPQAPVEKPKPNNMLAKPSENLQSESANSMPSKDTPQTQNVFIADIAESSVSSELPSIDAMIEAGENSIAAADVAAQEAIAESVVEPAALQQPVLFPLLSALDISSPLLDSKVSLPIASNKPQKVKRHAEVAPSVISFRIEDFEDVESPREMNMPMYDMSKEELILLAMEQAQQIVPGSEISARRPAPYSSKEIYQYAAPEAEGMYANEDSEAIVVDMRNAGLMHETGLPKPKPKGDSNYGEQHGKGRNKPRPYGMDKPSKSRPTLDGGMKDKNEHFGLPHHSSADLIQKDQFGAGDNATPNVLGWQLPTLKWASFSNIFQGFMGGAKGRKSDATPAELSAIPEKCVDDDGEQAPEEGIRSSNALCSVSLNEKSNYCNSACISKGFASGNCLGSSPTPGCMCKLPNAKEYSMMLSPLKEQKIDDLAVSDVTPCKKCACEESCKQGGSFTGFCMDRCYCAVPWYTKL